MKFEIHFKNYFSKTLCVRFKNNRIAFSCLFSLLIILCYSQPAIAQIDFIFKDAQKPDSFKVNFELEDSLIYVTASLNDKPEKFLLDNGCPLLVINADHWHTIMDADSNISAKGVGGKVNTGVVFINSFNWNGIQKDSFKVMAASLPNLGKDICGLLGYDVFKDYRVTFDFGAKHLIFVKPGKNNFIGDTDSLVRVPFALEKHLPVLKVFLGSDTLTVAVDCGANQNLLSSMIISSIKNISNLKSTVLRGAGPPVLVKTGILDSVYISGLIYRNMQFTFDDSSIGRLNETTHLKVDGLLGYPFLKSYKTTIDFPNGVIEIRKNK